MVKKDFLTKPASTARYHSAASGFTQKSIFPTAAVDSISSQYCLPAAGNGKKERSRYRTEQWITDSEIRTQMIL